MQIRSVVFKIFGSRTQRPIFLAHRQIITPSYTRLHVVDEHVTVKRLCYSYFTIQQMLNTLITMAIF